MKRSASLTHTQKRTSSRCESGRRPVALAVSTAQLTRGRADRYRSSPRPRLIDLLPALLPALLLACGGVDDTRLPEDHDLSPGRDVGAIALDAGPVDEGQDDGGLPVLDAEARDGAPDSASDGAPDSAPFTDAAPDGGAPLECPDGMARVPAGDFPFGPAGEPRFLPDFCIDVAEVSAGEFLDCVADEACDGYEEWALCLDMDPRRPHQCRPDMLDHPANWIDWYRAEQYCRWAGKRLPDEGMWEKAATGVDGRMYPWGDGIDCRDAHVERGDPFDTCLGVDGLPDGPVPVDAYGDNPGPYGALNMVGNVREWLDLRVDREVLPDEDETAVAKGGDWRSSFDQVMNPDRDGTLSVSRAARSTGFRCALDL